MIEPHRAWDGRTPLVLPVDPAGVPRELVNNRAWVVWRLKPRPGRIGTWSKVPYQAREPGSPTSVRDPSTWTTFSQAFI